MSYSNIEAHTFLMPDYYPQFACKMGKCRHACCVGWPISISMQNYFRLLGMNCPKHLRKKLDVGMQVYDRPDPARYAYFVPDFQGDCPMRMAGGRCSLHAEMGPAVLPDICRLYPRGIRAENGEYECSCANSCEAVLELLFARKEPITFVERTLTISLPPVAERTTFFETLGLTRQIRLYCISILQTRRMTLSERLGMLGKQLAKIDSLLGSKNKRALEELLREPVPCQPLPEQSCALLPEGLRITAQMLERLNERSTGIAAYGKPAMQSYGPEADLPARYAAAKGKRPFAARQNHYLPNAVRLVTCQPIVKISAVIFTRNRNAAPSAVSIRFCFAPNKATAPFLLSQSLFSCRIRQILHIVCFRSRQTDPHTLCVAAAFYLAAR